MATIHAQLQEVLAKYPMNTRFASIEVTGQYRVALINLEAAQLPQADCAAPRSLEALRLEDPATMSGCWNPGCAMAGCPPHISTFANTCKGFYTELRRPHVLFIALSRSLWLHMFISTVNIR